MADSDSSIAGARGRNGFDYRAFLRFAIPSLLGVLAFLTPIVDDGQITIGLAILSNALAALLKLFSRGAKLRSLALLQFLSDLTDMRAIWM